MSFSSTQRLFLFLALVVVFSTTASAQVYIQEYCNDPYGSSTQTLDTNLDGVFATSGSQSNDEFVELINAGQTSIDISGWTVADSYAVRHTFDGGTNLPGGCSIVVFGGGDVTNFNSLGIATGVLASGGSLGLNNSSDTINVADATGVVVATHSYVSGGPGDGDGESLTRDPETPGSAFVKHTILGATIFHSAGYRNDGVTAYCGALVAGVAYPGNGTDAALTVSINGSVHNAGNNVHPINGGDNVSFNCATPLGGLNGGQFILAFYVFTSGSPAAPISLPGDAAAAVWLSPAMSSILVDGMGNPTAMFSPTLSTWGFNYGPVNIPVSMTGAGNSIMLQIITSDPGLNSVNIGAADAHELEVM